MKTDVTVSDGAGCLRSYTALCVVPYLVEAGDSEASVPRAAWVVMEYDFVTKG